MFKVMSFNIRGFVHDDGANVWPARADLNAETIVRHAPDIIGFQELMPGNVAYYDTALPDYDYRLGPRVSATNPRGDWEHPAIYWRRGRFTLLDSGEYFLNKTPETYARDWGADQGRGLTWARLRDEQAGREFVFMNTHFDHRSGEARLQSALLVCAKTADLFGDLPVILTGDFNTVPHFQDADGSAYDIFIGAGFRDAFDAATAEDAASTTFHGFLGPAYEGPSGRIDWILYRDPSQRLRPLDTRLLRDGAPPLFPSDHYPIVATFAWE